MCDAVQRHPIDPVYPYTTLFRSREARGVMGGDLGETRGRDRAGSARLGEDDFGGVRKELAGDLVDRLIAERSIDEPDFAPGKILCDELRDNILPGAKARPSVESIVVRREPFDAPR